MFDTFAKFFTRAISFYKDADADKLTHSFIDRASEIDFGKSQTFDGILQVE